MLSRIWKIAEELILEHASRRVKDHTDIGGADLEVVEDVCKEIFELCMKIATDSTDVHKLQSMLELRDAEEGT